ncbi:hypothetical protein MJO29_006727 [Puccinia striiformis f. sp. tritici]|nr:hypothetical protein MJO29_006727 [Puccinia striiformis f. sp. tritici]
MQLIVPLWIYIFQFNVRRLQLNLGSSAEAERLCRLINPIISTPLGQSALTEATNSQQIAQEAQLSEQEIYQATDMEIVKPEQTSGLGNNEESPEIQPGAQLAALPEEGLRSRLNRILAAPGFHELVQQMNDIRKNS